jgi:hypothetical protein
MGTDSAHPAAGARFRGPAARSAVGPGALRTVMVAELDRQVWFVAATLACAGIGLFRSISFSLSR